MSKRGRKMLGKSIRVPFSFTIETDVLQEFREHCKSNGVSASFIVQRNIEQYMKEVKK